MTDQPAPSAGSTTRENVTGDLVHHAQAEPEESVSFTLDGRPVSGRKGEMLIAAPNGPAPSSPLLLPPRMKSVGVCRMCLVEVSGPRGRPCNPVATSRCRRDRRWSPIPTRSRRPRTAFSSSS